MSTNVDLYITLMIWQKLLWRRQPYPDNYVPDSFLQELRELRESKDC